MKRERERKGGKRKGEEDKEAENGKQIERNNNNIKRRGGKGGWKQGKTNREIKQELKRAAAAAAAAAVAPVLASVDQRVCVARFWPKEKDNSRESQEQTD